ncbi:MAG: flagellar hook protein FlgE [Janthinobacterium lividum]
MTFQQGLSGLNAASKTLEVIGNNVSNAATVGFKSSTAVFADVYAAALNGSGAATSQIGIGTNLTEVQQQFSQGNITTTENPLDVAINGTGFFRLVSNGVTTYSRNGQFQLDKSGNLVSPTGSQLTGYIADSNQVLATGAPQVLNLSTADQPPKASTAVSTVLNIDSRQAVPTSTPFAITDPNSYNNATEVSVFDSLGNSHSLQTFYVKTADNTWNVYAASDQTLIGAQPPAAATPVGQLVFGADGALTAATKAAMPFSAVLPISTGATNPQTVTINYSGTTQFGSSFSVNTLEQDGYTSGHLAGFNIGSDGIIAGRYTNGKTATLGQIALANFANTNGLLALGNNVWAETSTSGSPLVGVPNSASLGVLQASAVEDSNVDLTAQLVNMITAQRIYQANAQTIKTQDSMLQTLVSLR